VLKKQFHVVIATDVLDGTLQVCI